MKICIYGAGAIGGYVGAMLTQGGADVSPIARGEHLKVIRRHGLRLEIDGNRITTQMPASESPGDFDQQDYVIIALLALVSERQVCIRCRRVFPSVAWSMGSAPVPNQREM